MGAARPTHGARRRHSLMIVLIAGVLFAFALGADLGPATLAAEPPDAVHAADVTGDGALADEPIVAPAQATPNCPGTLAAGDAPDAPCTALKIHGNVYEDFNRNGRYDPNAGRDTRMPGITVRLINADTAAVLGQAVTNQDGYYAFPGLPIGPRYIVQVLAPACCEATTPTSLEFELRDFSTYWCCSARGDFGLHQPGYVPGQPPPPGPPVGIPGKPPCCEVPTGQQTHLPILSYQANDNVCSTIIEVQNIGAWDSKAMLLVWGAPGACPPQCTGPLKVECSGLLRPGSTWNFLGAQLPQRAKSGMVFSAPAIHSPGGDIFADLLCERLFHEVVGDCNAYRRFKKAYNEHGVWLAQDYAFDFSAYPGASLAVEVVRKCPGDANPMVTATGGYTGLADGMLGMYDPVYGGYTFFAPLIYAGKSAWSSWLYIQNGGLECSSVELWFKAQDDCLRPKICDILTLAPGETYQFDATTCVGPDWLGSAMIRGSEPLSVVVDQIGSDLLMSYTAQPGQIEYAAQGAQLFSPGSQVAYGPLLYSEHQGWDSLVQVGNLSNTHAARVKVYFLDRGGDVITTLVDWICPGGGQSFFLPVVSDLPGNWVGSVRVESQEWVTPGAPAVPHADIVAVAQLVKHADVQRSQPLEAVTYELFPEQRAYDWQVGSGWGGLYSGVGRIGVPSLMKDVGGLGLTTELSIQNLVAKPGFTDFIVYIYDQNGLIDSFCQKLHSQQVEYIDVARNLAFLPEGFKGSGVISAVYWEHHVFAPQGQFLRNLVGLASVTLERTGTLFGADVPGDESSAQQGIPIIGPFAYSGPVPNCPGVPRHVPCCPPPGGPGQPPPPTQGAPPPVPTPPSPPMP